MSIHSDPTVHNQRNTHDNISEIHLASFEKYKESRYSVFSLIVVYALYVYCSAKSGERRIVRTFISIFPFPSLLHMRYFTGRKPQDFRHYPVDFHSKLCRLSTGNKHDKNRIETGKPQEIPFQEKIEKSRMKRNRGI